MTELVPEVKEVLKRQISDLETLNMAGVSIYGLDSETLIIHTNDYWFAIHAENYYEDLEMRLGTSFSPVSSELWMLVQAGLLFRQAYADQCDLDLKKRLEGKRLTKKRRQRQAKRNEKEMYERLKRKFEGRE